MTGNRRKKTHRQHPLNLKHPPSSVSFADTFSRTCGRRTACRRNLKQILVGIRPSDDHWPSPDAWLRM